MIKKILAVFMAVVMAVSCLSVNALAFDFGGSERTKQEAFEDWFEALREFAKDPVNKADDMIKANHRFNTDMVALGYEDYYDYLQGFTGGLLNDGGVSAVINDATVNKFTDILNNYGIDTPKQQFEDWYREKYGKEYYKRDFPIENLKKNNYQYYIKSDCGNFYQWVFFNSTRTVFDVENSSGYKFIHVTDVTDGYYVSKYKDGSSTNHSEYDPSGYYGLDVNPYQYSSGKVLDHNLPLNYWGDILEPSGNIDDIFDEFGEGEGEGLTADEFDDLLNDLLQELLDNMPDLTTVEGILQAIYRKCCEISNKIGKTTTNVYKQTLQGIQTSLDNINAFCSSFWTDFSNSMQTLFIPEENYAADQYDALIETFNNKFGFASDIKSEIDDCITLLDKPPVSTFSIHYKSIKLDLSVFDSHIDLIRYCIAIPIYFVFIVRIYRKTPWYMQGGGE